MSKEELPNLLSAQNQDDVLQPLLVLRAAELRHRKCGGARPECIKLSPDFYDRFMNSYRHIRDILRSQGRDDEADQIDIEHPHLLGLPIIQEAIGDNDIEFYVSPLSAKDLPRIIIA